MENAICHVSLLSFHAAQASCHAGNPSCQMDFCRVDRKKIASHGKYQPQNLPVD
jgi:hypothetical protein